MRIDSPSSYTTTGGIDYNSAANSLTRRQASQMDASEQSTAPASVSCKEDAELRKACRDFEAVLVGQMLSSMRSTVQKSDFFGSDKKEEMFQSMLDDEISKNCSQNGSFHISDMIYEQMSRKIR